MRIYSTAFAAALLAAAPAAADDITDALNAAIEAYEAGEIQDALGEIAYATQLLNELKQADLVAFLPEAPDGWTRTLSDDAASAVGFMGGGSAAEAIYSGPGGSFSITMIADNPMVGAMAGILSNPALMSNMGRIERINGENFMDADGELSGLIAGRILIQASGADTATMSAILSEIDFDALAGFGT